MARELRLYPVESRHSRSSERQRVGLVAATLLVASAPVIYRDHSEWLLASLAVLGVTALMMARWRVHVTGAVALFVLWATVSLFWTSDPANSWIDVPTLVVSVILGSSLASFGARVAARGLFLGTCIAAAASLAVGIVLPRIGRSVEFDGALIGIYAHRNFLASVAVLGLALAVSFLFDAKSSKTRFAYAIAVALFAIASFQTQSGTAIVITLVVTLGASVLWLFRTVGPLGRLALVPIVIVAIVVAIPPLVRSIPALAESVGRDLTFTGRTDIWNIVLTMSAERPLTGFGWGGVWRGDLGDVIRATFGWDTANSAHNAFLDAVIQVGWIGAALLVWAVLVALFRSIGLSLRSSSYTWMALLMIALVINSVSESQATRVIGTFLVAMISSIAWAERKSLRGLDRDLRGQRSMHSLPQPPSLARK